MSRIDLTLRYKSHVFAKMLRVVPTGAQNRGHFGDATAWVCASPRLSQCEGIPLPGAAATR